MKTQRVGIWAKVKILADIESNNDGDVLVSEILNELNSTFKGGVAVFGKLLEPEIMLVLPEKVDLYQDDAIYSKEIDMTEWLDTKFAGEM